MSVPPDYETIILELKTKHNALEECRARLELFKRENEKLRHQSKLVETECKEKVDTMTKDIVLKDAKIDALEARVKATKTGDVMMDAASDKILELQDQFKDAKNEARRENQRLRAELEALADFKASKKDMEMELIRYKDVISEMRRQHEDSIASIQQHYLEEKARYRAETERKLEQIRSLAIEEAFIRLGDKAKQLWSQRHELEAQLRQHVLESDELQRDKSVLKEQERSLKVKLQLGENMVQQQTAQAVKQNKQIRDLNDRVLQLEQQLEATMAANKSTLATTTAEHRDVVDTVKYETSELKKQLEVKDKEMLKLRRLCNVILDQRSEVEHFFLEALEHVKKNINNPTATPPINMPRSNTAATTSSRLTTPSTSEWEQKEKVLRLLFAKILKTKSIEHPGLDPRLAQFLQQNAPPA